MRTNAGRNAHTHPGMETSTSTGTNAMRMRAAAQGVWATQSATGGLSR